MRPLAIATLFAAALAAPPAGPARADDGRAARMIEEARRHMAALRYQEALDHLGRALATGTGGPAQVAEIHRLSGELAAGLGDRAAAAEHFARLLALHPDHELPPGTSPKLTEPFSEALALVGARGGLAIDHRVEPGRVVLVVRRDPLAMVSGVRVRYRSGAGSGVVEARGSDRIAVELPTAAAAEVVIAALDLHGNELALLAGGAPIPVAAAAGSATADSAAAPASGVDHPPPGPPRSVFGRWSTWGLIALVSGTTGALFGVGALQAERALDDLNRRSREEPFVHDYARAEALEVRGQRFALLANASFALGAAATVVAGALLVRDLKSDSDPGAEPALSAGPIPGHGFGVSLRLRY